MRKYWIEILLASIFIGLIWWTYNQPKPIATDQNGQKIDSLQIIKDSLTIHEQFITTRIIERKIVYDSQKVFIDRISNDSNTNLLLSNIARFKSSEDIK
jgi:hypothetical protein